MIPNPCCCLVIQKRVAIGRSNSITALRTSSKRKFTAENFPPSLEQGSQD
jgi:hypothetical protein